MPQNYPNIFHILWEDVDLEGVTFKPMGESISVQGDIHIFVLYEGEGENTPIRFYENTIPFNRNLECSGSRDDMTGLITFEIGQKIWKSNRISTARNECFRWNWCWMCL